MEHSLRESRPENCLIITQYPITSGQSTEDSLCSLETTQQRPVSVIPTKDLISSALQLPTNTLTV